MTTVAVLAVALAVSVALFRVGLAILDRPQRGLLLLVALLPFDGLLLLVDLPGVVAGWKEALTIAVVAATFIAPAPARAAQGRIMPAWVGAVSALVVVALIWVGIQGPSGIIGLKISFFFLLVPFALWRCPFNASERDTLVTILMVASVIEAVLGLVQQAVGGEFLVSLGYEWNTAIRTTWGLLRSIGTFEQPFPFAFFIMTALAFCVPVALGDRQRTRNRVYLLLTPLVVLGMATAIVRGAFVGIGVAVFIVAIYKYRMLVHLLAPLLILMVLLSGPIGSALFSSSSLFERTDRWEVVIDRVVEQPFGGGPTASGAAADAVAAPRQAVESHFSLSKDRPLQPDNYYLKVLVDYGVIGMWLIMLTVYFAVRYAWRVMRRATGEDSAYAAGICATLGAAAAAALVSTYLEIFPAELLFWMLLGVLPSLDPQFASTPSRSDLAGAESRPTFEKSSERSLN